MSPKFDVHRYAALVRVPSLDRIDYLIRIGAIVPAEASPRRGISKRFDCRNLIEGMVSHALLVRRVHPDDVRRAMQLLRAKFTTLRAAGSTALVLMDRSAISARPSIDLLPASEVARFVDAGYFVTAVPVSAVMRLIEEKFPGAFGMTPETLDVHEAVS